MGKGGKGEGGPITALMRGAQGRVRSGGYALENIWCCRRSSWLLKLRQEEAERNVNDKSWLSDDFIRVNDELSAGEQKNTTSNIEKQKSCLRTSEWDEGLSVDT